MSSGDLTSDFSFKINNIIGPPSLEPAGTFFIDSYDELGNRLEEC